MCRATLLAEAAVKPLFHSVTLCLLPNAENALLIPPRRNPCHFGLERKRVGQQCSSEENRRQAALYETGLLFSDPSRNFDRITDLASRLFKTKVSLISFASDDFVWHKSRHGCDLPALARLGSFCDRTIQSDAPVIVNDAMRDPVFASHPRVVAGPGIRFYAGAPISLAPGVRIGSIGILDPLPRHFTPEDAEALGLFAKMIVTEIRLLATARALRDILAM